MGVNPVRFAVAVSGGLACLMLGLLAGVSAGSSQTGHVLSVETVTRTARAPLQAAVARIVTVDGKVRAETLTAQQAARLQANAVTETVTRTVTDPVTVTETQTVAGAPPPPGPGHKHKKDKHKGGSGPGGPGPGDGQGGDGGGDGG
jgi:hypothetical protein